MGHLVVGLYGCTVKCRRVIGNDFLKWFGTSLKQIQEIKDTFTALMLERRVFRITAKTKLL